MTIMPVIFPPGPYPSTGGLVPDGSGDINIAAQFTENSGTPEGDYWIIPGGLDPLNPLVACLAANPDPGITVLVSYSFDVEFDRALGANEAVVVGVGAGVGAPGGPPPAWNQALYGWSIDATGVGYLSALESGTGPNVYGSSSSPANPSSYPLGAPVTISGSTYLPLDYLTSNSGSLLNSIFFFVNTQKLDTLTNGALTTVISNVVVTADVVLPPGHPCAATFADLGISALPTQSGTPGVGTVFNGDFSNAGPGAVTTNWLLSLTSLLPPSGGSVFIDTVDPGIGFEVDLGSGFVPFVGPVNVTGTLNARFTNVPLGVYPISATLTPDISALPGEQIDLQIGIQSTDELLGVTDTNLTNNGTLWSLLVSSASAVPTVTSSLGSGVREPVDPGTCEQVTYSVTVDADSEVTGTVDVFNNTGGATVQLVSATSPNPLLLSSPVGSFIPLGSPITYSTNGIPLLVGEQIDFVLEVCYPPGENVLSVVEAQVTADTGTAQAQAGNAFIVGAVEVPGCANNPIAPPFVPGGWTSYYGPGGVDISAALATGSYTHAVTGGVAGALATLQFGPTCGLEKMATITLTPTYPVSPPTNGFRFGIGAADAAGVPVASSVVSSSHEVVSLASALGASLGALDNLWTVQQDQLGGNPVTITIITTADQFTVAVDDSGTGASQWDITVSAAECACAVTVCPDITATAIATPSSQIVDSCQIVDVVVDITTSGDPAQLLLVPVIPPGSTIVAPTYLTYVNASGPSTLVSTAGALVDVLSGGTIQALIRIATHCAGVGVGSLDVIEPCSATVLASGTFELTHN